MFKRRSEPGEPPQPEVDYHAERAALDALLRRIESAAEPLKAFGASLAAVETRVGTLETRTMTAARQLADVETAASALGTVAEEVKGLTESLKEARQTAEKLTAPDGDLHQQKRTVEQLVAQSLQSRATLDTLASEQKNLETLAGDVKRAVESLSQARLLVTTTVNEIETVRSSAAEARAAQAELRDLATRTRSDADAATAMVRDVDLKIQGFSKLQDIARQVEERTSALNSMAEHVLQKTKVLELQKGAVEQAVLESHRVSELVRAMEAKVATLEGASRRGVNVEEMVERIDAALRQSGQQLQLAEQSRDALSADLAALDRQRAGLTEFVRQYEDRLAGSRRDLDAQQTRVSHLQEGVAGVERAHQALAARVPEIDQLRERIGALTAQITEHDASAAEFGEKMASLEEIHDHLVSVDEMSRRATWQMESLKNARLDLEELRGEIETFYREQSEALQLRDKLAAERAALESFLERMSAFAVQVPDLDDRMNAIKSKLSIVDEGTAKAANLVVMADDLDRRMTRVAGQQQFVERIEARVNALNVMTADIDKKLDDQTRRRAEIETLRNQCDAVGIQVTDIRQKLDGIGQTQSKLLPVADAVAALRSDVERVQSRLAAALQDQARLNDQERRISAMLESVRSIGSESSERLVQAQNLTSSLEKAETIKDSLVKELTAVQGRQREVAGQLETADSQMQALTLTLRSLEQRHDQLAFSEKRISTFEAKVGELRGATETIERRIQDVVSRDETVQSIRREVEGVQEISARSKADLAHLEAHRGEVVALRANVDELLETARLTEQRIREINAQRRLVDEVQLKAAVTKNMLADVRVHLETVSEQKAVLEHALDQIARLELISRDAEATLRSLQAERELAQRIERSIQQLRSRTAVPEDKRSLG
jgi:chromosome segregation ATPase